MNKEIAIQICPHCRAQHFLVCEACWLEVPWNLKVEYWGAKCFHHLYPTPATEQRFTHAMVIIISHLKQFSSAL